MGSFPGTGVFEGFSSQAVSVLILVFVNGTVLFLLMSVVIALFHNVSSSCRHRMWFFVICGIFALALFSHFIPHFHSSPLEVPVYKGVSIPSYDSRLQLSGAPQYTSTSTVYPDNFITADTGVYRSDATAVIGIKTVQLSSLAVLVWFSGMTLLFLRILVGRIGLFFILRNARPDCSARAAKLLGKAVVRLQLKKKIDLRISKGCMVPFTFSIPGQVILLPENVDSWPDERLLVVLLHELCHIKRMDAVTRRVARLACVFFWFLPVIWILYRKLQWEEENACDAMVVDSDVKPAAYAGHLLDVARMSGGKAFFFELDHAFARKARLEKRIIRILTLKTEHRSYGNIFSSRFLSVFISCLLLLLLLRPVSATDRPAFISGEAPLVLLYGTWENPSYNETWKKGAECPSRQAKLTLDRDGTIHFFRNTFTPEYSHIGEMGTWEITNSWIDRAGNSWYEVKYYYPITYGYFYHLWRIDKSGHVLEIMYNWADYPKTFDRESTEYRIYHRM